MHGPTCSGMGSRDPEHCFELGDFDPKEIFLADWLRILRNRKSLELHIPSRFAPGGLKSASLSIQIGATGMATALSARLLLRCPDRNLEPHWDAANPESCRLAENWDTNLRNLQGVHIQRIERDKIGNHH